MPEVERYSTPREPQTEAYMEITFPDSLENTAVPVAIKEQMVAYSHTFTGAEVRVYGYGPSFYGGGGQPAELRDPGARLQLRAGPGHRRGHRQPARSG